MSPQEKAEQICRPYTLFDESRRALVEDIRVALVEAANEELTKRRAAEAALMHAPSIECDKSHTIIKVWNPITERWYETYMIAAREVRS